MGDANNNNGDIAWVLPTNAANPIPKSLEMHGTNHPRIG